MQGESRTKAEAIGGPARVLAVDDVPANLLAIESILEPLGVEVITARSGPEALACAAESEFAVAILDIMMPAMDGFETLRQLRNVPSFNNTPVILLSAYEPEPRAIENAYAMGAADYVYKPVAPNVLRAKVGVFVSLYRRGLELLRRGEALEAKDRNIAILAHDLGCPLTSIVLSAEFLGRAGTMRRDRAVADRILRAGRRMDLMIRDLLEFARLGVGHLPVTPDDMDIADLCRELVTELRLHGSSIALDIDGDGRGKWDRQRVHQALSNLMTNAVKYGDGQVRVDVRQIANEVRIHVWNAGEPIPPERLERIFEPFERGAGRGSGLGLGLYIVREIAGAHGGSVTVKSCRETGTTFTVTLPVRAREASSV
jgi:signal transduction histidine kinase